MISSLLVANRGEIARRVFTTCRSLGIRTVAVYSDPDADAPHVRAADLAVRLPGAAPSETYLRGDLLIDAAQRAGADAIHPGYGFLSESAAFAEAVLAAGLTWIGPPPSAIAAMGSKVEAKARLGDAGVPMLASWSRAKDVTDFPVLVKASAGGGGRGMRVVRSRAELPEAMAAARREAQQSFGDGTVFCERYIETGRHIEVQIFADTHGHTVALGERECSIQRRHQKIIEEAPSTAVDPDLRERLFTAATAAARAVGYVGAGTVEFLLAPDGAFYFLEMNTRLQVEHPVTECVTGLDLVRLQLDVANGRPLPFDGPPAPHGHAIEVRLYAEEPAHDWRPSTGRLDRFTVPVDTAFSITNPASGGPRLDSFVRLDSGVESGSVVSTHYDPMLAKVIAWAPYREDAARLLASALDRAELHGVATNRELLAATLREPEFLAGGTDTAYLGRHPEVFAPRVGADQRRTYVLAAALAETAARRGEAAWGALPAGWRNVATAQPPRSYRVDGETVAVSYQLDRAGQLVDDEVGLVSADADAVVLGVGGVRRVYGVHATPERTYVDGPEGSLVLTPVARFPLPTVDKPAGSLLAPMPATVGKVSASLGQRVEAGALLLTLEAMKLEHPVYAPESGVLTTLNVEPGTQVEAGVILAVITTDAAATADETPMEEGAR